MAAWSAERSAATSTRDERRQALEAEYRALEYTPSGQTVAWGSSAGGRYGEVVAASALPGRIAGLPPVCAYGLYGRPAADGARHGLPQRRRKLDAADLGLPVVACRAAGRRRLSSNGRIGRAFLDGISRGGAKMAAPIRLDEVSCCSGSIAALLTLAACLAVLVPLVRGRRPARRTPSGDTISKSIATSSPSSSATPRRGLIGRPRPRRRGPRSAAASCSLQPRGDAREAGRTRAEWRAPAGTAAVLAVPLRRLGALCGARLAGTAGRSRWRSGWRKRPPTAASRNWSRAPRRILRPIPADGRGWDVLAPIYLRLGRYGDAVTAYRNAIRLNGGERRARERARRGDGRRAPAASSRRRRTAAFERALALEPRQPKARFYLASALAQEGRIDEAAAAWQAMLRRRCRPIRPGSAGRRGDGGHRRMALGRPSAAARGPTQARDRRGSRLVGRRSRGDDRDAWSPSSTSGCAKTRDDPEGWLRLVRSYHVLGKQRRCARDALARGPGGARPRQRRGQGARGTGDGRSASTERRTR